MNVKNLPDTKSRVAVLLPARRVEAALAPLVEELLAAGIGAIILVDDGCPAEEKPGIGFAGAEGAASICSAMRSISARAARSRPA